MHTFGENKGFAPGAPKTTNMVKTPGKSMVYQKHFEGAQTVKCKPWTERVAEKGLSRGVSRAAWKRRINRELEGKKAHKPWTREGRSPWSANRELGTFHLENSSVSVHSLHFMVCAPLSFFLFPDSSCKRYRAIWCRNPSKSAPKVPVNVLTSRVAITKDIAMPQIAVNSNRQQVVLGFLDLVGRCERGPPFHGSRS